MKIILIKIKLIIIIFKQFTSLLKSSKNIISSFYFIIIQLHLKYSMYIRIFLIFYTILVMCSVCEEIRRNIPDRHFV